jgi:Ferritin-like domain
MKDQKNVSGKNKAPRRDLLGSGALAAVGVLFGALAAACGDDDDETSPPATGDGGPDGSTRSLDAGADTGVAIVDAGVLDNDLAPLNALLSAEYAAITAYDAGAGLILGAPTTDALYALREVIKDIAVDIQSQHKLHAAALVGSIRGLGGTPVLQSEIAAKFAPPAGLVANPTIINVLKFAAGAERNAAVSYNKVLAGLEDAKLRYLATAIEGDESQHFIVLAALVLGLAAPGPNLSSQRAGDVVPQAFVRSVGEVPGLEKAPPNYFS